MIEVSGRCAFSAFCGRRPKSLYVCWFRKIGTTVTSFDISGPGAEVQLLIVSPRSGSPPGVHVVGSQAEHDQRHGLAVNGDQLRVVHLRPRASLVRKRSLHWRTSSTSAAPVLAIRRP